MANAVMKVYNGTQWVTASGFQVDNSNGNFSLSKTLTVSTLIANGTGANAYIRVPNGPSADESSITPAAGMVRFDTTTNYFRGYDGTTWTDLSSGNLTNLYVSGNAQIDGTLGVDGNVTLGNDATSDTLTVNATADLSGDVIVGTTTADSLTVNSTSTFNGASLYPNRQSIRFYQGSTDTTNYVALKAPASITANVTWSLPDKDGSPGQVLSTDGAGVLSFSDISSNPVLLFDQVIADDFTVPTGKNAMSVGIVQVATGKTLTVESGSRYVVV